MSNKFVAKFQNLLIYLKSIYINLVPLRMIFLPWCSALLSLNLPVSEAPSPLFWRNGVQECRRFLFNNFHRLPVFPLKNQFLFGEQEDVCRDQIQWVRRMIGKFSMIFFFFNSRTSPILLIVLITKNRSDLFLSLGKSSDNVQN